MKIRTSVSSLNRLILFALLAVSISAGALEIRLSVSQVPVGGLADLRGTATAGLTAVIVVSGPESVPGKQVIAGRDGLFAAELGPFPAAGDYTIAVSAGAERKTVTLTVTAPTQSLGMAPGSFGAAFEEAADSSDEVLTAVKSDLDAIPGDDLDLKKAKEDVDEVRNAVAQIRDKMQTFTHHERRLEEMLLC
jgi:hypothetical protein